MKRNEIILGAVIIFSIAISILAANSKILLDGETGEPYDVRTHDLGNGMVRTDVTSYSTGETSSGVLTRSTNSYRGNICSSDSSCRNVRMPDNGNKRIDTQWNY